MQSPGLALIVQSPKIIDAVGRIAALLDLGQQESCTDGVNTAGGYIEHIAWLDLRPVNHLHETARTDAFCKVLTVVAYHKAVVEASPRFGTKNHPHFGFAQGAFADHPLGLFIVGMHLQGKILGSR
jgi:hypothetical protein